MNLFNRSKETSHGKMRIMGRSGDVAVEWSTDNPTQVQEARKQFIENVKKGYLTFEVTPEDKTPRMVKEFNPYAQELVIVPPISGG